jgi:hypothetical protein
VPVVADVIVTFDPLISYAIDPTPRGARKHHPNGVTGRAPFTFYRGAALPMAADLASTPASGLRVQLRVRLAGAEPGLRRQRFRPHPAVRPAAQPSVLAEYAGRSQYYNRIQRVVAGPPF